MDELDRGRALAALREEHGFEARLRGGRYGEIWGDMGRYVEMFGDVGRCEGDAGRYGEMRGDMASPG